MPNTHEAEVGGLLEPGKRRARHSTPAWVTEPDPVSKKKKKVVLLLKTHLKGFVWLRFS